MSQRPRHSRPHPLLLWITLRMTPGSLGVQLLYHRPRHCYSSPPFRLSSTSSPALTPVAHTHTGTKPASIRSSSCALDIHGPVWLHGRERALDVGPDLLWRGLLRSQPCKDAYGRKAHVNARSAERGQRWELGGAAGLECPGPAQILPFAALYVITIRAAAPPRRPVRASTFSRPPPQAHNNESVGDVALLDVPFCFDPDRVARSGWKYLLCSLIIRGTLRVRPVRPSPRRAPLEDAFAVRGMACGAAVPIGGWINLALRRLAPAIGIQLWHSPFIVHQHHQRVPSRGKAPDAALGPSSSAAASETPKK